MPSVIERPHTRRRTGTSGKVTLRPGYPLKPATDFTRLSRTRRPHRGREADHWKRRLVDDLPVLPQPGAQMIAKLAAALDLRGVAVLAGRRQRQKNLQPSHDT